jgi:hypothetical protein
MLLLDIPDLTDEEKRSFSTYLSFVLANEANVFFPQAVLIDALFSQKNSDFSKAKDLGEKLLLMSNVSSNLKEQARALLLAINNSI